MLDYSRQLYFTSFIDCEMRVPSNFPQMAIRIRKVATMSAPEHILSRLNNFTASSSCDFEDYSDFLLGPNILCERDPTKSTPIRLYSRVFREQALV